MDLYVKSGFNGKFLKITAFFTDIKKANKFLRKYPYQGVILEKEGVIFCADINDLGEGEWGK